MLIGVESRAAERNAETAGFGAVCRRSTGGRRPRSRSPLPRGHSAFLAYVTTTPIRRAGSKGAARKRPLGDTKNALLVGGQLAGSLKIVFGDEDLAPAAEGRAPEDPSRRDVGVAVDAVDALAAKESTSRVSAAPSSGTTVNRTLSTHSSSHSQPGNGSLADPREGDSLTATTGGLRRVVAARLYCSDDLEPSLRDPCDPGRDDSWRSGQRRTAHRWIHLSGESRRSNLHRVEAKPPRLGG